MTTILTVCLDTTDFMQHKEDQSQGWLLEEEEEIHYVHTASKGL